MEQHDDKMKALLAELEADAPKYWSKALRIGQDQWRTQSSRRVLAIVGEDYDGGLLEHGVIEQLVDMLEVDATAQYVLLAHNAIQEELAAEECADTAMLLHQFAAQRIPSGQSVTGRYYTLYLYRCGVCLRTSCNFTDCPDSLLTQQGQAH